VEAIRNKDMVRNFGSSHKLAIYNNAVDIYEKLFNVNLNQTNKKALVLALSSLKYGQIYPISRVEAKTAILSRDWTKIKEQVEYFERILKESKSSNLILNQAIAKTISESKNRHVVYQDLVAPFSYCSIKAGDIVHRPDDFESQLDFDFVDEPKYDLHDEGHFVMGHLDERFGYKLQSPYFESSLTDVSDFRYILDGRDSINHNYFFNKIGYSTFYNYLFLDKGSDIESLISRPENYVEAISEEVLYFLRTGEFIEYDIKKQNSCDLNEKPIGLKNNIIDPRELAVLVQIMFSEAGSSEIGEELYTRGSPSGKRSKYEYDKLTKLSAIEKIQMVASLFEAKTQSGDSLKLHHENRSTLRIRGILIGYLKYAKTQLDSCNNAKDALLLKKIIEQIEEVYIGGSVESINLFETVEENINNPTYHYSFDEFIEDFDKRIKNKPSQVIAISGSSASGKSTLLSLIKDKFPNLNLVSLDDFQNGRDFMNEINHPLKFDHKSNINIDEVNLLLKSFKLGKPYIVPSYSFIEGVSTNNCDIKDNYKIEGKEVLVIEGIFANLRETKANIDLSCYIEAPFYQSFIKRIIRDRERFKGTKSDLEILETVLNQVYESYKSMILPQRVNADIIIHSEFNFNYLIEFFTLKPIDESRNCKQLLFKEGEIKAFINDKNRLIITFENKVYYSTKLTLNLINKLIKTNFNN
jgi:uridine kinase